MTSPPVYLKTSDVVPKILSPLPEPCTPDVILDQTWGKPVRSWENEKTKERGELLQSSFDGRDCTNMRPQQHGLVGTVLLAYHEHHHLVLRPDDIWIAIIAQFSFYVNAHAEDLRSHFVAHEGKKTLLVEVDHCDFEEVAERMSETIHENVVDGDLARWILPNFTTTTMHDTIVSAALMMALLKSYFVYEAMETCGIPSITLEGTKDDWTKILQRIDKLEGFGHEPSAWAALLRPILTQFVRAFDGKENIEFWKRIVDFHPICGGPFISGWISTFAVWTGSGEWIGPYLYPELEGCDSKGYALWATGRGKYPSNNVCEVISGFFHVENIPVGFCDVDLKILGSSPEKDTECMIVAGNVALDVEGVTVRPVPGWLMFVKDKDKKGPPDWGRAKKKKSKRTEKMKRKEDDKPKDEKKNSGDSIRSRKRGISLRSVLNVVFCRG
ncbi:hypothetical protein BDN70DRAFT_835495 [Pholiota conissans]|uniref:Uncharacterized protein n=1 Tax=Pholiota conissans TaxID=109636 RepID=A0A9P5Z0A6_9AGAR|nr:hypothetical protein BDN70DRAFT_835495 [Pholiota conissans]